jgi:phage terminase large subunit GpA-like protein
MVAQGRWRAQRPEAGPGHAGFKIHALVSALPHATWPKLVAQWEAAQGDDERVKAFCNVILGEPWSEDVDDLDESALAGSVEDFDLESIPREVLLLTGGIDCQDDRLECSIVGWSRDGAAFVLAHQTYWGGPGDAEFFAAVFVDQADSRLVLFRALKIVA